MVQFGKRLCLIHIHPTHSGLQVSPWKHSELFWGPWRELQVRWYISGSLRFCSSQDFEEEEGRNLAATYMYGNGLAAPSFKSLTVQVPLMIVIFPYWNAQKNNVVDLFYAMKIALTIFSKYFHIIVFLERKICLVKSRET